MSGQLDALHPVVEELQDAPGAVAAIEELQRGPRCRAAAPPSPARTATTGSTSPCAAARQRPCHGRTPFHASCVTGTCIGSRIDEVTATRSCRAARRAAGLTGGRRARGEDDLCFQSAGGAPRQKWMPWPNPKWAWPARSMSNRSGSGKPGLVASRRPGAEVDRNRSADPRVLAGPVLLAAQYWTALGLERGRGVRKCSLRASRDVSTVEPSAHFSATVTSGQSAVCSRRALSCSLTRSAFQR